MGRRISSSAELTVVERAARSVSRVGPTGWGRAPCPICPSVVGTPDPHAALGVHFSSGKFHCFRCGCWGRISTAGADDDAPPRLDRAAHGADPELGPPPDWEPLWREPGSSAISLAPARRYLADRGVSSQTVEEARIGACLSGAVGGRVVAPLLTIDGEWVGWQARLWTEPRGRQLKYVSATGMDRESNVYNPAALAVETDVPALVVEGMFDALPYWPDAVALFGKPSEGQVSALLSAPRPIVVVLDGDAWLEAEMLAARLAFDGARAGWVHLPPKTDPNDVDPAWLVEEARRAVG